MLQSDVLYLRTHVLQGGASLELDKVCAESVQDLMATIAKLDSNGVQVLPEPEPAPVHSSTDDTRGKAPPVQTLDRARLPGVSATRRKWTLQPASTQLLVCSSHYYLLPRETISKALSVA